MNWNSKYNPFGNYDDPVPPSDKWPGRPYWLRWLLWHFWRNPLHNFAAYWIGGRGRDWDYTSIWKRGNGFNVVLPFVSYRGKRVEFYIGWRPDSRMFGAALRRRDK